MVGQNHDVCQNCLMPEFVSSCVCGSLYTALATILYLLL